MITKSVQNIPVMGGVSPRFSNIEPPGHREEQVLLIPKVLNPGHIRLGKVLAADPEYLFADNFLADG
jgi:hypothetical protein